MDWYGVPNLGFEFLIDKVLIVKEKKDLSSSVEYIIKNEKRFINLNDFCKFDGKSTQRVVKKISQSIKKNIK